MAEFKFFCPQCGQHIQCDTSYSGRQINCPLCQQTIVVPQPLRADGATPVPVKPQTLRKVLVIAAAVVALAGLITVGWFGYSKIRILTWADIYRPAWWRFGRAKAMERIRRVWNNKNAGKMLQAFVADDDRHGFKKLAPRCKDIMRLHDHVRLNFKSKYNAPDEAGKGGNFG